MEFDEKIQKVQKVQKVWKQRRQFLKRDPDEREKLWPEMKRISMCWIRIQVN